MKMLPKAKIEIDIPADEWVERIGKTAYEMLNNNRITLKTSQNGQCTVLSLNLTTLRQLHRLGYRKTS